MSPKILQGFHGLGRRIVTVSLAVTCPESLVQPTGTSNPPCCCPAHLSRTQLPFCSLLHSPGGTSKQAQSREPVPGSLPRGRRQRCGQGTNMKRPLTGYAHIPLDLVQVVPSGKCWEQSPQPTYRGKGIREPAISNFHFFPVPSVLRALQLTLNL